MIKLIASDIDGTLVVDGSDGINPEIFDVILRLKKHGIQFAAASGRQHPSISKLFAPISDKIFLISENGAYIGCKGRELYSIPLKQEDVRELIRQVREIPGCEIMLGGKDYEYVETDDPKMLDLLINGYHNDLKQVPDLLKVEEEFIKLSIYYDGDVMSVAGFMKERWSDRLKVAEAGKIWLDFMNPSVSKGAALKVIQDALEILPEETMVFGDQINDLEMVREARYSFAVANARPETKAEARYICDSNVNDGVLKVLKVLADVLDRGAAWSEAQFEEALKGVLSR